MTAKFSKTCQTCFRAKIKCTTSTQNAPKCDRCLRLNKNCVFPLSRRTVSSKHAARQVTPGQGVFAAESSETEASAIDPASACDPFATGILSAATGQSLIELYASTMVSRFPFVVVPDVSVSGFHTTHPALCLAILTAAAYEDPVLQQDLGVMFNRLVSVRYLQGFVPAIELLQALLVSLAWAHYQPRPHVYSPQLNLAISIVTDLRLDRSRRMSFWEVTAATDPPAQDWGPHEIRALAGAYYLASSSSILLQKFRCMSYRPYILQACYSLANQHLEPNDKFIPLIVSFQNIIEQVNDAFAWHEDVPAVQSFATSRLDALRAEMAQVKSSITFPIIESRILLLQIKIAELFLNQSASRASLFGLENLRTGQHSYGSSPEFLPWLSENMLATRSIIDSCLSLPSGEEVFVPNLEWIAIYCGMSLAARLDIVAAQPQIQRATTQLRRLCDVGMSLRQVALRLQGVSDKYHSAGECKHALYHLSLRARRLEAWYLQRLPEDIASSQTAPSSDGCTQYPGVGGTSSSFSGFADVAPSHAMSAPFPDASMFNTVDDSAVSEILSQIGADPNFGNFLFTMPGSADDASI